MPEDPGASVAGHSRKRVFLVHGEKINDACLYRRLDRIQPHKTKLEQHLKEHYGELFGAEFDVPLYDLTSTYVEGAAEKNPVVRRGYSLRSQTGLRADG
jgi:hypothetical protein